MLQGCTTCYNRWLAVYADEVGMKYHNLCWGHNFVIWVQFLSGTKCHGTASKYANYARRPWRGAAGSRLGTARCFRVELNRDEPCARGPYFHSRRLTKGLAALGKIGPLFLFVAIKVWRYDAYSTSLSSVRPTRADRCTSVCRLPLDCCACPGRRC